MTFIASFKTAVHSALHQAQRNCAAAKAASLKAATHARYSNGVHPSATAHHASHGGFRSPSSHSKEGPWHHSWHQQYHPPTGSPFDFNLTFQFKRAASSSTGAATAAKATSRDYGNNAAAAAEVAAAMWPRGAYNGGWSTWSQWRAHRQHWRSHYKAWRRLDPNKGHSRAQFKLLLLETYLAKQMRQSPQSCPQHGRARTSPYCGGFGGGRFRIEFDHAKWRAWRARHRQAHARSRIRRFRKCQGPCPAELGTWFVGRQMDGSCQRMKRLAPAFNVHAHCANPNGASAGPNLTTSAAPSSSSSDSSSSPHDTHGSSYGSGNGYHHHQYQQHETRSSLLSNRHGTQSGFLRPRAFPPGYGGSLLTSVPTASAQSSSKRCPEMNLLINRLFCTSSKKEGPEVFLKAAYLLKSSNALHWINVLFRLSVTFIPLSWKRAAMARKLKLAQLAVGATVSTPFWHTIFKVICRSAIALPFVLLLAVLLAALERTPITGRLRLLLLNQDEEVDIVNKVLDIGEPVSAASLSNNTVNTNMATMQTSIGQQERDWLAIMRSVLGEEDAPAGTLLGGRVLDKFDWRTRLVEQVLAKLEHGIPELDLITDSSTPSIGSGLIEIQPPPLKYPLSKSQRCSHTSPHNAVLVIERPESNAFSFGFYGCVDKAQPGVVIVFTGAIDEIMHGQKHDGDTAYKVEPAHEQREPSWIRACLGNVFPQTPTLAAQQQLANQRQVSHPMNQMQEEALAVLLAHELAHLVLSHTIESYANTALLWPQLEKLGWDMLRVFIYPITAILGPFVQDAISATVKVGIEESAEGRGLLPALSSSCESKKLEFEADAVGLRLLANAGIDPRSAIQFWEERLSQQQPPHYNHHHDHSHSTSEEMGGLRTELRQMHPQHRHSEANETHSFIKTHPADEERIAAIKKELSRWTTNKPMQR